MYTFNYSMFAEEWMKFFEVKNCHLIKYLMAMKIRGYAIVGAERTVFGEELHESQLPKKMVLVLGYAYLIQLHS